MSACSDQSDMGVHGHALTIETLAKLEHWLAADGGFPEPGIAAELLLIHYVFEISVERHGMQASTALLEGAMTAMLMTVGHRGPADLFDLVDYIKRGMATGRKGG